VKKFITATFGKSQLPARWPHKQAHDYKEETRTEPQFVEAHPNRDRQEFTGRWFQTRAAPTLQPTRVECTPYDLRI
jgi:hypothetical protein